MQIEVEVKGQRIKRINSPGSVEDTLNYLTCHFTFDGSEWENTIKTAYFKNRATEKIYSSLIADDGTCTVPWESLTDKGYVEFSAAGERENYRITTGIESFYNSKTVYGGEPSEPPTPDQYDQLIALAQETKEIAESVREDADAGEFDGEPGKPGDPGKDGVSPSAKVEQTDAGAMVTVTDATGTTTAKLKNGKDGNPGQDATDEQVRTAVDAYMKEHPIQGDTDDIIKLAIKNETSGAVPISITDSADMGVQELAMRGWTEQKRYEGKNLFDEARARTFESYTLGLSNYYDLEIPVVAGKTYIFNRNKTNGYQLGAKNLGIRQSKNENVTLWLVHDTVEVLNHETIEIIATGDTIVIATNITNQEELTRIFDECFLDAQLEEGSTPTTYEPYTGGAPSPSPEYPQEIMHAGNHNSETQKYQYEVKLTAKNLFVLQDLVDKVAETSNPAIGVILTITALKPSTRYTLSASIDGSVSGDYTNRCLYLNSNDGQSAVYRDHPVTKMTSVDGTISIWFYGGRNESQTILDGQGNVQLEEGGSATEYEEYKEQLVSLTSDRQLTKFDRLEKRDGVWGWVYKSIEITLDGRENWIPYPDFGGYYTNSGFLPFSDNRRTGFSEVAFIGYRTDAFSIWLGANSSRLYVAFAQQYDPELEDRGIENWKNWLSEKPMKILTYADGETFIPLSAEEQEQMNALHTYYPTTMLSNDAGCEMTIKYIADTKAYIAAIQAAVVNRI